jgi:hypothetical protein
MRFSYIMGGCAEVLTDKEWKWLTLVLPPQKPRTDHHARDHLALVDGILRALL